MDKVEKNAEMETIDSHLLAVCSVQLNYGYIAREKAIFNGYAKRIFTDLVSCVNTKRPRIAWMDSSYYHTRAFDDGIARKC